MSPGKVKTKKVVGVPTVPLTHRGYRTMDQMDRVYGGLGAQGTVVSDDPLAQYEREEAVDALQELRGLKAKKKRIELKQKIEQEKAALGAVDTTGGGLNIQGMYNFSPQDMLAISKMSEGDQQAFYGTLQRIGMMAAMQPRGGVAGQGMGNPILQMMAMGGFGKQGQGLGLRDVIELQRTWETIYQGRGKGNEELTNSLLLKLMTETVPGLQTQANQNLQMGYNAIIGQLQQNQSDPMRDLKYAKEMAGMMGYGPMNESEGVATLRLDMQDRHHRDIMQQRRDELKEQRNLGIIQQVLASLQGFTKNAARQGFKNIFSQPQTQPVPPPQQAQPVPQPMQQPAPAQQITHRIPMDATVPSKVRLMHYPCQKCGATMPAPEGVTTVTCHNCGQVHTDQVGAR